MLHQQEADLMRCFLILLYLLSFVYLYYNPGIKHTVEKSFRLLFMGTNALFSFNG